MADLRANAITLLASVSGCDLNAAGGTEKELYTVPAGKKCLVTHVVLHSFDDTAASAVITFGKTGGNCDEWRGNQALSNMTGSTLYTVLYLDQDTHSTPEAGLILNAAEVFGMEITTPQGAAVTCTIDVFGYLFDA